MKMSGGVMLVEDEPMIALMVADMIEAYDLKVACVFRSNAQAIAWLADHRPDLAVIDFGLADGRADFLAQRLVRQVTPFCVISGFPRAAAGPLFQDVAWIDKPFSQEELYLALRACHAPQRAGSCKCVRGR